MTDTKRKKPAKMSPTQRTTAWLRKAGFTCAVTERWNSWTKQRQDLFGFIDLVAIKDDGQPGVLAIQATTGSNAAARVTKILGIPEAKLWLECGNRILVIGWRKLKTNRWEPAVTKIELEMFKSP